MKESKLLEMQNKVESLKNVVSYMLAELQNLTDLSVGTLEALKKMPGYDKAIKKLKEDLEKGKNKENKKQNGIIEQDTK